MAKQTELTETHLKVLRSLGSSDVWYEGAPGSNVFKGIADELVEMGYVTTGRIDAFDTVYMLTPAGLAALSEPATDAGEGAGGVTLALIENPPTSEQRIQELERKNAQLADALMQCENDEAEHTDEIAALRAERDALRAALARTLNTLEGDKNLLCGATKWRTVEAVERSIKHMIADILKVLSGA